MNGPRITALRRERRAACRIPYTAHITPHVIQTESRDYVQVFQLTGASFESADDEVLNNWHERLNVLWRNIASADVALWVHLIRRREQTASIEEATLDFAGGLATKYRAKLSTQTLMVNELYLSVVYRPVRGAAPGMIAKLLAGRGSAGQVTDIADARDACEKRAQTLCSSLARYEPEPLGTYAHRNRRFSSALEFFGFLINAERLTMPLPAAPLNEFLAISRPIFGSETIEYRQPTRTRYGAILGIKEYATPSSVGMFNGLLAAPFELVLTQSFSFLSKGTSQGLLQRQYNQMLNAGDFAVSQAEELKDARFTDRK